jgi:hypothetical protein
VALGKNAVQPRDISAPSDGDHDPTGAPRMQTDTLARPEKETQNVFRMIRE